MHFRLLLFLLLAVLIPGRVVAHPVPFKNALSLMTWNQPFFNETMVTYSFARQAAIAGQYMRMDMDDGEMKYYGPQFNLLAKRWNGSDHQANLYLVGGGGGYEFEDRQKTAALAGMETDYETTKVYFSGKFTGLFPSIDDNTYVSTYRAGVSVYPAEFDEMSSWVILDVQHNTRAEHAVTVTPVLRLFYKNMLAEIGSSFNGDWMLNFMAHL